MVMETDSVVTDCGKTVREPFRPCFVEILAESAEIGSIEPHRSVRTVPENEFAVPDHHRTVFSRRSIKT